MPLIKDPTKRAKAKKALRVVAAISTSGGSEVARAKMKIAQKAAGAVVDKMQKKDGGTIRKKKTYGGMAKKKMMAGGMAKKKMMAGGRTMYKDGGAMPKAKPC